MARLPAITSSDQMITQALRRLQRSAVKLHLLEMAGIGLAGGCIAGGAVILAGAFVQEVAHDRLSLCAGALALAGGAIGAAWGWITRQDIAEIARRVDHHKHLADLVTTSLWIIRRQGECASSRPSLVNRSASVDQSLSTSASSLQEAAHAPQDAIDAPQDTVRAPQNISQGADPMNACVLAMAAQAIRSIRHGEIAQPRLGRRAWSVIATCGLLMLMGVGWMSIPQTQAIGSSQSLLSRVQDSTGAAASRGDSPASIKSIELLAADSYDPSVPSDPLAIHQTPDHSAGGMPSSATHSRLATPDQPTPLAGATGSSRSGNSGLPRNDPAPAHDVGQNENDRLAARNLSGENRAMNPAIDEEPTNPWVPRPSAMVPEDRPTRNQAAGVTRVSSPGPIDSQARGSSGGDGVQTSPVDAVHSTAQSITGGIVTRRDPADDPSRAISAGNDPDPALPVPDAQDASHDSSAQVQENTTERMENIPAEFRLMVREFFSDQ